MTIAPTPALVALLGAMTVLVLAFGVVGPTFARRRELAQRLTGALSPSVVSPDLAGGRRSRSAIRSGRRSTNRWMRAIETRLEGAALDLTPTELLSAVAILAIAGGVVGFAITGDALGPLVCGPIAGAVPFIWMRMRKGRRQTAFRSQLADSVSLLGASVRAGHSLLQALEQVARESAEPTASAFSQVVREIGIGAAQDEALERLLKRYPSEDLDLIVTATNVQHQVGGSLAKVLDDIAATLRERVRIEGDIAALTAQQRYSAYVLALLPVFVAIALFLISRDYMQLLFQGALRFVALLAAIMIVLGFIAMRRIATIDV